MKEKLTQYILRVKKYIKDKEANQCTYSFDKSEELTVEEALDVLTINGAYQMGIEKERGSIETGKYADFLFISKDITSIPKNEIHTAEISNVYFEGNEVYKK